MCTLGWYEFNLQYKYCCFWMFILLSCVVFFLLRIQKRFPMYCFAPILPVYMYTQIVEKNLILNPGGSRSKHNWERKKIKFRSKPRKFKCVTSTPPRVN